jgi:hypothetical protein
MTAREGLSICEKTGHRQWKAELQRLEGIALRGLNRLEEAQNALAEALRISRNQQARAFELRAAFALAQFWCDQGKVQQARELLAPVYGWFTEGFDTRDLKVAKALLEELAAKRSVEETNSPPTISLSGRPRTMPLAYGEGDEEAPHSKRQISDAANSKDDQTAVSSLTEASGRGTSAAREESAVARLTRELDDALERQAATSEVLSMVSSSSGELDLIFRAILEKETRICEANFELLFRLDNGVVQAVVMLGLRPLLRL